MINRLPLSFIFSCICLLQLGCSATSPKSIQPPAQVTEWDTRLSGKAGTLSITFNLPHQANAEVSLSNEAIKHKQYTPVRISVKNENCLRGHQVSVHYVQESSTFLTKYFSQEAIWDKSNNLSVQWSEDRQMTITLNDETIALEQFKTPRQLKIVSLMAPMTIEKFEYSPQH